MKWNCGILISHGTDDNPNEAHSKGELKMTVTKDGQIRTAYHIIYDRLQPIMDKLGDDDYVKLESDGFMPLSIDRLWTDEDGAVRISMAHNYIQNGDVMADPDMEIMVYPDRQMAEAMTFQMPNIFQQVYMVNDAGQKMVDLKAKRELNNFLKMWLRNIKRQGFLG